MAKRKVQTARRIRACRAGAFRRYLGTDSGQAWAAEMARSIAAHARQRSGKPDASKADDREADDA